MRGDTEILIKFVEIDYILKIRFMSKFSLAWCNTTFRGIAFILYIVLVYYVKTTKWLRRLHFSSDIRHDQVLILVGRLVYNIFLLRCVPR
jgi:hypothetical protein